MLKQLTILGLLFTSSSAFAGTACFDVRAALLEPCQNGEQHYFVKGSCRKTYEFINAVCVNPAKTLLQIKGDVLEVTEQNGMMKITVDEDADVVKRDARITKDMAEEFAANGFEATAKSSLQVKVCENAIMTVEVGEGNILPNADGTETYKLAEVLSFNCAK